MKFELTNHARKAVAEREIPIEWIEQTLEAPELIVSDPSDATIERCFDGFLNLAGECCESQ